jgi:hypothetical protein
MKTKEDVKKSRSPMAMPSIFFRTPWMSDALKNPEGDS